MKSKLEVDALFEPTTKGISGEGQRVLMLSFLFRDMAREMYDIIPVDNNQQAFMALSEARHSAIEALFNKPKEKESVEEAQDKVSYPVRVRRNSQQKVHDEPKEKV